MITFNVEGGLQPFSVVPGQIKAGFRQQSQQPYRQNDWVNTVYVSSCFLLTSDFNSYFTIMSYVCIFFKTLYFCIYCLQSADKQL